MKQTAVEWFWLNLTDDLIGDLAPEKILKIYELKEQAKAMEKEQIRDAFNSGMNDSVDYFIPFLEPNDESENYYNKTFKSE